MDLESSPLYLRAFELDDLETIYRWHNDPDLYSTLLSAFRPVNRSNTEEWLRKRMAYSPNEENYAVCLKSSSQHIGNVYLRQIDWINRHAVVGLFLGNTADRSKGYGTEVLCLIQKRAFEDLGLNRIWIHAFADNVGVLRAAEKSDFVVEGRLRQHVYKAGEFKDVLVVAVTADSYFAGRK